MLYNFRIRCDCDFAAFSVLPDENPGTVQLF